MLLFGSFEEAKDYSCKISIKKRFGIELNYSGPVHSLDKTEKAIINSGFLLMIGPNVAKNLMDKERRLKIDVTIRNLKKEAISMKSQLSYQKDSYLSGDIYIDSDRIRYSDSE